MVRRVDRDDARAYRVYLTDKAEEIKDGLFRLMRDWDEKLLASLTDRERDQFIQLVQKIGRSFAEHDRCFFCPHADCQ